MGSTLKIKNKDGAWEEVPALTGKSAYEIARKNGFEGTEKEWLASLKAGMPDWNESDESSESYIQNRTHYAEAVYGEKTILDTRTISDNFGSFIAHPENHVAFVPGEKYAVNWDGEIVICMATIFETNADICVIRREDVDDLDDRYFEMRYAKTGAWTFKIYCNHLPRAGYCEVMLYSETVKQLNPKFIPDYVPRTYVDEVTKDIQGDNTKTIADGSIALGINTTAGRRGYYIKSVDAAAKKIYLSAEQVIPPKMSDADNTDADFPTPGYDVGDYISIIAGSHYYFCATIRAIQNNVITYDGDLGFKSFSMDDAPDGYTLSVPSKPEVGVVTLGASGFVAGEGNLGNGRGVFMGGRDNVGSNYASVGGRGNTAGYGVGVFGTFNFVPGLGSFGGGNKHEIWGRYCGFSGNGNYIAPGVVESVIEGLSNRIETSHTRGGGYNSKSRNGSLNTFHGENLDIEGSFNDVEGRGHKVRGDFNFVRGDNLIAVGNQAVLGAYNIEDPDKLLIVGGGTEKERKNILTIDRNGNFKCESAEALQSDVATLQKKVASMADFTVREVMEGLTEEITIAPRFSFFGAYYRVLSDGAPIEEAYLPIGEALRTAHGALWAENVQITLYDKDKTETMRCRLKLAHEDVNMKYGHLERVV